MKASLLADQHLFTAKQLMDCCVANYLPTSDGAMRGSDNPGRDTEQTHGDDFVTERRALVFSVVCHLSLVVRFALEELGEGLTEFGSHGGFKRWLSQVFSEHSNLGVCCDELHKHLDSGKITHSPLLAFTSIRRDSNSWLVVLESLAASTKISLKEWEESQIRRDLRVVPVGAQNVDIEDKINLIASSNDSSLGTFAGPSLHWAEYDVPSLLVLCRELQQALARIRTDNSEF